MGAGILKRIVVSILFVILYFGLEFYIGYLVSIFLYQRWGVLSTELAYYTIKGLTFSIVLLGWFFFEKRAKLAYTKQTVVSRFILFVILTISTVGFILFKKYNGHTYTNNSLSLYQISIHLLFILVLIPVAEELFFRDFLFRINVKSKKDILAGAITISVLFLLIHVDLNDLDFVYLLFIAIVSLQYFFLRLHFGLFDAILGHALVNFLLFLSFLYG